MIPYSPQRHQEPIAETLAVDVIAVSSTYQHPQTPALKGVTLQVPIGARIALIGPNGAGKSTLLKLIAGLLPLHSGTITIFGDPVGSCRHRVAYLAQRSAVDWRFPMTVQRLVGTGRYIHLGWFKRLGVTDKAVVADVMAQLQIEHLADRQIGQLSGGQQQRALLARTLAQSADLLLLDEPLNAVDVKTRAIVMETLNRLKTEGKTVLIATHDLQRIEQEFDRVLYLNEGEAMSPPPVNLSTNNLSAISVNGTDNGTNGDHALELDEQNNELAA